MLRLFTRSWKPCRLGGMLKLTIQLPSSRWYTSSFPRFERREMHREVEQINNVGKQSIKGEKHDHDSYEDTNSEIVTGGKSTSWIEHEAIPSWMKPYLKLARADKQVGTALLFWPCLWSISLAAPTGMPPDMYMVTKFATGAVIMRSAGCVINDIWDR